MSTEAVIRREDGPGGGRYVLDLGGVEAELTWKVLGPGRIVADHTLVPDALRGTGVGRQLVDRLVATDAPDEVLVAATAEVSAAADRFSGYHQGSLYGFSEMANAGDRPDPLYDHSPLIGIANPLAPPMTIRQEDDTIVAEATFGQAYEGPPGCVHGGYVAAAFDELLGATQSLSGAPGMTGTLSVRYESPTPLHEPLRLVGRLVGVERRKIFTEGTCYAGERVTATATGLFISMQPGQFLDLLAEREALGEDLR